MRLKLWKIKCLLTFTIFFLIVSNIFWAYNYLKINMDVMFLEDSIDVFIILHRDNNSYNLSEYYPSNTRIDNKRVIKIQENLRSYLIENPR